MFWFGFAAGFALCVGLGRVWHWLFKDFEG